MLILTPLRLPSHFVVRHHEFYVPDAMTPEEQKKYGYSCSMLSLYESTYLTSIDIRWTGEKEDGAYTIQIWRGGPGGLPLFGFESRDYAEIVRMLDAAVVIASRGEFTERMAEIPLPTYQYPPLAAVRIPTDFEITWNQFSNPVEVAPDMREKWCFEEDLLMIFHTRRLILVDVGCYGRRQPTYGISVFHGDWQGRRILTFAHPDCDTTIAKLENILAHIAAGEPIHAPWRASRWHENP